MESASPPNTAIALALAALPAALATLFAAATAALGVLSVPHRAALRERLAGPARAALDRYIIHGATIEARWLVLRVLGIVWSALLFYRALPGLGSWTLPVAALTGLLVYALPAEIAKVLAERTAERSASWLLRALRPFEFVVAPIALPVSLLGRVATNWIAERQPLVARVTETEVELIVNEGEQSGSLDHEQSEMIRNVLDFGDLTAGEVMVPRTQVMAFEISTAPAELMQRVVEAEHSRYPVFRERIDNVIGMLHVKDLITFVSRNKIDDLKLDELVRRPAVFVPEGQSASSVLRDMRAERHHMAVVIDEFGGVSGIVTLEDLIEEIVGDIRDEHDVEEPPIVDLGDGRLMVDASVPIGDLSRYLGTALPENGAYNSLGGFIVERIGRVPKVGARLNAHDFEFIVREADERHVAKVEILRTPPSPESLAPRSRTISAA